MSSAMDKALLAMSLEDEEEEVPFDLHGLPEYSSCERNILSLVGRTLYPDCQKMKHLIRDMPRKWGKIGKVRGLALSAEKFQFIFKSQHDLDDVLEKGVHTYNEWVIAVERWVEHPPEDYLQVLPIWIQIWKIPVNHYTAVSITALADLVGKVQCVEFDEESSQVQEFVRVKVLFDIARPLRRSKVVNLPDGTSTKIHYEYERIQKRCYECQRLTHEKDYCPFLIKKRQDIADARRRGQAMEKPKKSAFLKESDPLFGVLTEDQVGINPHTGRPRIAPDVLEGMRQYLNVSNEDVRRIHIERVKKSVREVEKDPIVAKFVLQLEPTPLISPVINKGKGIVFNYEELVGATNEIRSVPSGEKLMASAFHADASIKSRLGNAFLLTDNAPMDFLGLSQPSFDSSTVYRTGFFETSSSGTVKKVSKARKRPQKNVRKQRVLKANSNSDSSTLKTGLEIAIAEKRKVVEKGVGSSKVAKLKAKEVIPDEGSPNV